jgi:hypothetical protein
MTAVTHVRTRILRDIRWFLVVIMAVQALLSARLIWSNTAFQDEALYLWAGHVEFAHWFFGSPEPEFPAYFGGAPVIYPPLAALADSFGGLAAARMLSLVFMLGATWLLWGTTARMYGRRAALAAAGLWSVLGPVIRLGAFATYDAMALFLVALAAWWATARRGKEDATPQILLAAAALTLANATKYATVIFDPAVIALAVAAGYPAPGGKHAWRRGALLVYWVVVGTIVLLQFGQGEYLAGISATTLRIDAFTSLNQHVAFGAWFAAIAVGYGADRIVGWLAARSALRLRVPVAAAVPLSLIPLSAVGMRQAESLFAWPGVGNQVPVLRAAITPDARYLTDTATPLQYYLPGTSWRQWTSLSADPAQAERGLAHHAYTLVIEDDSEDIKATGYRQVATVPYSGPDHRGSYRILEYVG